MKALSGDRSTLSYPELTQDPRLGTAALQESTWVVPVDDAGTNRPSRRRRCRPLVDRRRRDAAQPTSPSPRAHCKALLQAGFTMGQIARIAGVPEARVRSLPYQRLDSVAPQVAHAVMNVSLIPTDGRDMTPAVGAGRRVRALAALGWPIDEIARRTAASVQVLGKLAADSWTMTTSELWWKIFDVYEELSGTVGPDDQCRSAAIDRGWVTPLAWDDDEIDHPGRCPHLPKDVAGLIDEIAVDRAWSCGAAEPVELTIAEEQAVIARYDAERHRSVSPLSLEDLAMMLGKTFDATNRQLERWRTRQRTAMIAPLTALLQAHATGQDTRDMFADFMQEFAGQFPENPCTTAKLVSVLAAREAAAPQRHTSSTPELLACLAS